MSAAVDKNDDKNKNEVDTKIINKNNIYNSVENNHDTSNNNLKNAVIKSHPYSIVKQDIIKSIEKYNLFDCKSMKNFLNSIYKELHWTGFSGSRFVKCRTKIDRDNNKYITFTVKIAFYNKTINEIYETNNNSNIENKKDGILIKDGENNKKIKYTNMTDCEIQILDIFTDEIYSTGISSNIILIYHHKKCNNLIKLSPSDQYCFRTFDTNYAQLYDAKDNKESIQSTLCAQKLSAMKGISYDSIAFIAIQHIDTTMKIYLEKYLDSPYNFILLKSMIFMIIYTMYRIKELFPKFQHSDLHTGNVTLVYDYININLNKVSVKYLKFQARAKTFYVPYFGVMPKIVDFGFSSLPERGIYNTIELDPRRTPSFPEDNDICMLFHRISTILTPKEQFPQVYNLLDHVDAHGTYIIYNREYLREHPNKITTLEQMISSNIWDDYTDNVPSDDLILFKFN